MGIYSTLYPFSRTAGSLVPMRTRLHGKAETEKAPLSAFRHTEFTARCLMMAGVHTDYIY